MTNGTPLERAQALVSDIRGRLDTMTLITLKSLLFELDDHLKQAATQAGAGTGEPASATLPPPAIILSAPLAIAPAVTESAALETLKDQVAAFTSLMVHEIRKPMTSIRGYSDMLAKPGMIGPLNDMQTQFIGIIRGNIIKMETLVTDINDLNKLNVARLRLDASFTTVSQIVGEVKKAAEALNAEYNHTLNWEIGEQLPPLNQDVKQLTKILIKLVSNAMQYTPPSGVITFRAARVEGERVTFSVTDSGIGIAPADLPRLGEAFFRADQELVTSQKGYGLGLAVASGLLALMGSALACQSVLGAGSTFSFTIQGAI